MSLSVHDIVANVTALNLQVELFKRREFDFIVTREHKGEIKTHHKQLRALQYLTDDTTNELTYGGAAGGAKTWTGCAWLIFMCLAYPEIKAFIARKQLKKIKSSTLITFKKAVAFYGVEGVKYHGTENYILFPNGSRIDLIDTAHKPSEDYETRFGSQEYTIGWFEEAAEQSFDAYDALKARVNRHLNEKYGLKPMILLTTNPKKNWIYSRIYKRFRDGTLPKDKAFLQAFVTDNVFGEEGYIDILRSIADKSRRDRLLKGDWEYSQDGDELMTYDQILAIFDTETFTAKDKANIIDNGLKSLTADVARQGSDKAINAVFSEVKTVSYLIDVEAYPKSKMTLLQASINRLRAKYKISKERSIADEDGIGGGVVDNCDIKGFLNNSKPLKENVGQSKKLPAYANLQTQCAYKLAERIREGRFKILAALTEKQKEDIIEELEQVKADKVDDDNKYFIKSKADIKNDIGRSPDWRDVFLMNEYFTFKKVKKLKVTSS